MTFFSAWNYKMRARGKQQPRADAFYDIVIVVSTWCIARYLFKLKLGLSNTGMLVHMRTNKSAKLSLSSHQWFSITGKLVIACIVICDCRKNKTKVHCRVSGVIKSFCLHDEKLRSLGEKFPNVALYMCCHQSLLLSGNEKMVLVISSSELNG